MPTTAGVSFVPHLLAGTPKAPAMTREVMQRLMKCKSYQLQVGTSLFIFVLVTQGTSGAAAEKVVACLIK